MLRGTGSEISASRRHPRGTARPGSKFPLLLQREDVNHVQPKVGFYDDFRRRRVRPDPPGSRRKANPRSSRRRPNARALPSSRRGYNPNAASTTATTQPQSGGRARGAAAGAMAGAAMGRSKANQYDNVSGEVAEEYTRNQMQDAAKAGAAVGASRQRQERRQGRKISSSNPPPLTHLMRRTLHAWRAKGFRDSKQGWFGGARPVGDR